MAPRCPRGAESSQDASSAPSATSLGQASILPLVCLPLGAPQFSVNFTVKPAHVYDGFSSPMGSLLQTLHHPPSLLRPSGVWSCPTSAACCPLPTPNTTILSIRDHNQCLMGLPPLHPVARTQFSLDTRLKYHRVHGKIYNPLLGFTNKSNIFPKTFFN